MTLILPGNESLHQTRHATVRIKADVQDPEPGQREQQRRTVRHGSWPLQLDGVRTTSMSRQRASNAQATPLKCEEPLKRNPPRFLGKLIRLAYTEALANETAATAIEFFHRARVFFTAHGIVRAIRVVFDNGPCYRAALFTRALTGANVARHQRTRPSPPNTTGSSSATRGPWPKNFSTPGSGPQKTNETRRSRTGTSTTTTIDPTLSPQTNLPPHDWPPTSPTSSAATVSPSPLVGKGSTTTPPPRCHRRAPHPTSRSPHPQYELHVRLDAK